MAIKSAQHTEQPEKVNSGDNKVVSLSASRADSPMFQIPVMERLLDALVRSIDDAESVTIITGDDGSGKSTLIERLYRPGRPNWAVCLIRAGHVIGEKHILEQLNAYFCPGQSNDLIGLAARVTAADSLHSVVIVDDAHNLSIFALDVLIKFKLAVEAQGGRLGLVLFARPSIQQLLSSPSLQRYDAIIRQVCLPALSAEQTTAYIDHLLELEGTTESSLLSVVQKQQIYKRSAGVPGKINTLVEGYIRKKDYQSTSLSAGVERMPVISGGGMGTVLAIVIGIAAVALVMSGGGDNETSGSPPSVVTMQGNTANPSQVTASVASVSQGVAAHTTGKEKSIQTQESQSQPGLVSGSRETQKIIQPSSNTKTDVDEIPKISKDRAVNVVPTKANSQAVQREATHKELPVITTTQKKADPVRAAVDESHTVAKVNEVAPVVEQPASHGNGKTKVQGQTENDVTASKPDVSAIEKPVVSVGKSALAGLSWMQSQPGDYYTVQLAASLDRRAIERFNERQPTLSDLHSVHIKKNGRDWYISVYGAFAGLAMAREAVSALPRSMRKNSPWIRQLSKIQKMVPSEPQPDATDTTDEASAILTVADEVRTNETTVRDSKLALPEQNPGSLESATSMVPSASVEEIANQIVITSPPDTPTDLAMPPVIE